MVSDLFLQKVANDNILTYQICMDFQYLQFVACCTSLALLVKELLLLIQQTWSKMNQFTTQNLQEWKIET